VGSSEDMIPTHKEKEPLLWYQVPLYFSTKERSAKKPISLLYMGAAYPHCWIVENVTNF
jgi:hypothetical protein